MDLLDDFTPGPTDFDDEDLVVVASGSVAEGTRRAAVLPRSLTRLSGEALEVASSVQHALADVGRLHELIAGHVVELRELGASWAAVGWCVGTTSEGARKRFGLVDLEG
jgi:hypothetical protein